MVNSLDLNLEELDSFEAPLTDMEWGLLAGAGTALIFLAVVT